MAKYRALIAFKTRLHAYQKGDAIAPDDHSGGSLSIEDRLARGHVERIDDEHAKAPEKAAGEHSPAA